MYSSFSETIYCLKFSITPLGNICIIVYFSLLILHYSLKTSILVISTLSTKTKVNSLYYDKSPNLESDFTLANNFNNISCSVAIT